MLVGEAEELSSSLALQGIHTMRQGTGGLLDFHRLAVTFRGGNARPLGCPTGLSSEVVNLLAAAGISTAFHGPSLHHIVEGGSSDSGIGALIHQIIVQERLELLVSSQSLSEIIHILQSV